MRPTAGWSLPNAVRLAEFQLTRDAATKHPPSVAAVCPTHAPVAGIVYLSEGGGRRSTSIARLSLGRNCFMTKGL
ncbi:hypothetical protein Mycsm_05866 [Mycobacterium sp. JS623]|nr:hypothetical protein Mycsm_05866 [Mycobacterium sp. JS623]